MTGLEGPVAGWALTKAGPLGRRVAQRVARDHLAIRGRKALPNHDYDAFYLFAAVAPSKMPGPSQSIDFIGAAHQFVRDGLPAMFTGKAEYSGGDLVRFRQPVGGPLDAKNSLMLSPTGLIELQWSLGALPDTTLPLGEIMAVVRRVHALVSSDAYPNLYRVRRLERWRRVDWRIGVNSRATPRNGGNTASWTELAPPVNLPSERIDEPRPFCPPDGFGARNLTSVRRDARSEDILAPALEGLLSAAGYTNAAEIRTCARELVSVPEGRP